MFHHSQVMHAVPWTVSMWSLVADVYVSFGYLSVRHGDCCHDTAADGYPGEELLSVQGTCLLLQWYPIGRCSEMGVCAVRCILGGVE